MFWSNRTIEKKNCGSCLHFIKVPGYGICGKMDWRCGSDYGRSCKHWKGKKYERVKKLWVMMENYNAY